jgi:hypothetical protein
MKVEFEFEVPDGMEVVPLEGVAVLRTLEGEGERIFYGVCGDPTDITALGLYTAALLEAKNDWLKEDDEE